MSSDGGGRRLHDVPLKRAKQIVKDFFITLSIEDKVIKFNREKAFISLFVSLIPHMSRLPSGKDN